ncbi:MAG: MFS transporter [Opitutales bacterium]
MNDDTKARLKEALREPNIRLFILFRILYVARFYYPIYTILFLDMGLTLEQFSLLNAVWAVTIVLCEVPSGALADVIGRKRLVVAASALMVLEMAVLVFVPLGNVELVFAAVAINRVLSGISEALASGADQALAYDTLTEKGLDDLWPRVLEKAMRYQGAAMVVAMLVGAASYDLAVVNWVVAALGFSTELTRETVLRFPIALNLITAVILLGITPRLREPNVDGDDNENGEPGAKKLSGAFGQVFQTGKWILSMPFVLFIILAFMVFDSTARMFATLSSEYFRLIEIPVAYFGFIGVAMVLLTLLAPTQGRFMVERFSIGPNFGTLFVIGLTGFVGCVFAIPYVGLIFAMIVFYLMTLSEFFASHYLNRSTASSRRATVLSFKGLAGNIAYGTVGLVYAGVSGAVKTDSMDESEVFAKALPSLPIWFVLTSLLLAGAGYFLLKRQSERDACVHKPEDADSEGKAPEGATA